MHPIPTRSSGFPRGVAVEVLPTPQAVRRYRELDPPRTAAALHLTC
jgi:hypothetical protein